MKRKQHILWLCLGVLILGLLCGCKKEKGESSMDETIKYAKVIRVDPSKDIVKGKTYQTITDAFHYVNENPPTKEAERILILVEPGIYRQFVTLEAPFVTLEGAGEKPEDTILTFYYGASRAYKSLPEAPTMTNTASTTISASAYDFIAENISFENSYSLYVSEEEKTDYCDTNVTLEQRLEEVTFKKFKKQALALRVDADRSAFYNCGFIGRQDTLFVDNYARTYFENCYIEGTTDFIFGSSTAVFESCLINTPERSGYVTASSAEKDCPYAFLFLNCTITREPTEYSVKDAIPKDQDYTLGRPWGALCQVIFWNCKMDDHIINGQDRYVNMRNEFPRTDCRLLEGNTMDLDGNLLDMSTVLADYMTELKQEDMDGFYSPYNHLKAKYNPSTKELEKPDFWNPGEYEETEAGKAVEIEPYMYN